MVSYTIRPFKASELEGYLKRRFQSAQKNNKALLNEGVSNIGLEIDSFDFAGIHLGCFLGDELLACVRVVSSSSYQALPVPSAIHYSLKKLSTPFYPPQGHSLPLLPSAYFLEPYQQAILNTYLRNLHQKGFKMSEAGRLISFSKKISIKLLLSCLSYVFAVNAFYGIDYCFFNATPAHARFYKKYFSCKPVLPSLSFDTGAKKEKKLLIADIKKLDCSQTAEIESILAHFKTGNFQYAF